jgi:putative DNA primase/helicase
VAKPIPFRRDKGVAKIAGGAELDDHDADYRGDKTPLPEGFRYARDGCIQHTICERKDGGYTWGFLCSPIEFAATTEDEFGKAPGLLVRIKNNSGKWHHLAFPRSALIGGDALLSDLVHHGLQFAPVGNVTNVLKRLLMSLVSNKRARCVPKVGWHEDAFVLPDEVFGQPDSHEIFFSRST